MIGAVPYKWTKDGVFGVYSLNKWKAIITRVVLPFMKCTKYGGQAR